MSVCSKSLDTLPHNIQCLDASPFASTPLDAEQEITVHETFRPRTSWDLLTMTKMLKKCYQRAQALLGEACTASLPGLKHLHELGGECDAGHDLRGIRRGRRLT